MPDLFLSYARDDQDVARRFAENLKREGFEVWWDQALNPGEAFDQVTEEALAAAKAVIVLWSKTSVSSRWVRAEATQANASHRLLPVMIEPCTRPIMFELTHTADLAQWKGNRDDPAWQAFVGSVRRFVQKRGSGEGVGLSEPAAVPRPSMRERLAGVATAVRRVAASTGSLLRRNAGRLAFALVGALLTGAVAWWMWPKPAHEVTRFEFNVPADIGDSGFAVAPDGRQIVYTGGGKLWSRSLEQEGATEIPDAAGATLPFFSPDSRSVAYAVVGADSSRNQLRAFDFATRATRVLATYTDIPGAIGSWGDAGHIITTRADFSGMYQMAEVGGVPEFVVKNGEYLAVAWQDLLPGGRWVLYTGLTAAGSWSTADIVAHNLVSGERKVVLKNAHAARYLPSGHLVFARSGALYAVAFDTVRMEARGKEVPVLQAVATNEGNGYAPYSVSANGTLVYLAGAPLGQRGAVRSVVHVNERGESAALSSEARTYSAPRASPDGSKVAVEVTDTDKHVHIWVMDARSGAATQLTFDSDEDRYPVWTSDSREVLYTAQRGKEFSLWRKAADGTGEARLVLKGTDALVATDVHGHTLVYQDRGAGEERDLFTLDLGGSGKPQQLLSTPDDEAGARISPDGVWIAYVSTPAKGGTPDRRIYVRPFPNAAAGGQRAISEGQGSGPVWSAKGDEIYYMIASRGIQLMAVKVSSTTSTITPTARRQLFTMQGRFDLTRTTRQLGYAAIYDVMPKSGELIAVLNGTTESRSTPDGAVATPRQLHVVMNWFEELKKLVPVE
jgi:hypothetical protein